MTTDELRNEWTLSAASAEKARKEGNKKEFVKLLKISHQNYLKWKSSLRQEIYIYG